MEEWKQNERTETDGRQTLGVMQKRSTSPTRRLCMEVEMKMQWYYLNDVVKANVSNTYIYIYLVNINVQSHDISDASSSGVGGVLSILNGDSGPSEMSPFVAARRRRLLCGCGVGDEGVNASNPSDCSRASMSRAISAVSVPPDVSSKLSVRGIAGRGSALGLARRALRPTVSPFRSFSKSVSRALVSSFS